MAPVVWVATVARLFSVSKRSNAPWDDAFVDKLDGVFAATNEFRVGTYGGVIHKRTKISIAEMGQ